MNVKTESNISRDGVLHASDAQSVNQWILNMQNSENSPVIFYKPQHVDNLNFPSLKTEDFLLVLMNQSQKELFNLYGNYVVCVDFTHGVNAHQFDLTTLLVLDDKREGLPAAFILSNRQNAVALEIAFGAIKKSGVSVKPKVFMSDELKLFIMRG